MKETKERKNKKTLIALLLLLVAFVVIVGYAVSFFSDMLTGGTINGAAGTLDIVADTTTTASVQYYVTPAGEQSQPLDETNLNPGDIVAVSLGVVNEGTKSAYLKGALTFTGTPSAAVHVYPMVTGLPAERDAIRADTTFANALTAPFVFPATGTVVINGTVEKETGGVDATTASPKVIGFYVYFDKAAGNSLQAANLFKAELTVSAMQYRNNPTQSWADVVTQPFTL